MVKNLQCEECVKFTVCSVFKKLKPFTDFAKEPAPVELTMDVCDEFLATSSDEQGYDSEE
jgi:hypothetical protein